MPRYESDVCIIGGGISSAMLAQKLSELRPGISITVVEAGPRLFDHLPAPGQELRTPTRLDLKPTGHDDHVEFPSLLASFS